MTDRGSLGRTRGREGVSKVCWFSGDRLTDPLRCDANRLSKCISVGASRKERAFKLTFRWK